MKASKKQWWRVCLTSVVVAFALACSCMIAGCGGGSGAVESKERVPEATSTLPASTREATSLTMASDTLLTCGISMATRRAPASI